MKNAIYNLLEQNNSQSTYPEMVSWLNHPIILNIVEFVMTKHWKTFLENHQTNNLGYQKGGFSICKNKFFQMSTF